MTWGKIVLVAAAVTLAACSSGAATPGHSSEATATPSPILVHGTVVLPGAASMRNTDTAGTECWSKGNSPMFPEPSSLDDVKEGAQVVITDATGATVATGTLSAGATTRAASGKDGDFPDCAFTFTASNVPPGKRFYGIKVGAHSQQVPQAALPSASVTFSN